MKKLFNNIFLLLFSTTLSLNLYSGIDEIRAALLSRLAKSKVPEVQHSASEVKSFQVLDGVEIKASEEARVSNAKGVNVSYVDYYLTQDREISHALVVVRGGDNVSDLLQTPLEENGFISQSKCMILQKLGLENIKGIRCIYFDWCPQLLEEKLIKDSKPNFDKYSISLASMGILSITRILSENIANLENIVFLGFGKGCEIISNYLFANHKKFESVKITCIFVGSTIDGEIACNHEIYNFYSRGDFYAATAGLKKFIPLSLDRKMESCFPDTSVFNIPIKTDGVSPSNHELIKWFLEKFNVLFDALNKFKHEIIFLRSLEVPFVIDFMSAKKDLKKDFRLYFQFSYSELDANYDKYIDRYVDVLQQQAQEDKQKTISDIALDNVLEKHKDFVKLSEVKQQEMFDAEYALLRQKAKDDAKLDEDFVRLMNSLKSADNSRNVLDVCSVEMSDCLINSGKDGAGMLSDSLEFQLLRLAYNKWFK